LRKIHFHGTPVTQVAPNSFLHLQSAWNICDIDIWGTGICNIGIRKFRTTTRFRIRLFPKHMEAQGFVSKNDRLEKADCQRIRLGGERRR
jgi:hypothetical protein